MAGTFYQRDGRITSSATDTPAMTDQTPTRAEVEAQRRAASFLRSQHKQLCFEQGDHKDEVDTAYSLGADAIERCTALRERAEAAERVIKAQDYDYGRAISERDAARRAEAAAWNDAIEAAAERVFEPEASEIRALRRSAPTEGEA